MGKSLDVILKIKSEVEKTLPKNLQNVASEMKKVKKAREKLERYDNLIQKQKQVGKTLASQKKALNDNRSAMMALEQVKKSGIKLTVQEEAKYKNLVKEQKKLDKQIKATNRSYKKYSMQLQQMKIPYDQLQNELRQTIKLENELIAKQKIKKWGEKTQEKFKGFKQSIKEKAKTTAIAGTTLAIAGLGASAKAYIDYDKGIRKVKALTGATSEEFRLLSLEAIRLGNTTKFTALEATQGMEKFALAGFKPQQIIQSLSGVMDLAAASGEDFTMIADIVSDHMRAYGMQAKDVGKMTDIMANTMARSNVSIETLGETLKYVSPSAKALNMDFATVAAATGLMGDQALKSGQAGRDLKAAFGQLADVKVQKSLKAYGIKVKDAQGNFVGLVNLVSQLENKTKKMTGLKKLEFFKKNFGEQGAMAIMNLINAEKEVNGQIYKGSEALRMFTQENENALGTAKKMKDTMMEGAGGSWDLFISAIDGLKITVGEKLFGNGGLDLLKKGTNYINELSNVIQGITNESSENKFWQDVKQNVEKLGDALKIAGKALIGIAKGINAIGVDNILVFITLFTMTSKVTKFIGAMQATIGVISQAGGVISALKIGIAALGGPISLIIAAVGVLAYVIYKNWDKIKGWLITIKEFLLKGFNWFVDTFKKNMYLLLGPLGIVIKLIIANFEEIKAAFTMIGEGIVNAWNWVIESLVTAWEWTVEKLKTIFGWIIGNTPIGLVLEFVSAWDSSKSILDNLMNIFDIFINKFTDFLPLKIAKEFFSIWTSNLSLGEKIKASFTSPFEIIKQKIEEVISAVKSFGESVADVPVLGSILKTIGIVEDNSPDGSHYNGLDYVPYDGYLAELHKGERVLTARENGELLNNLSITGNRDSGKTANQNQNKTVINIEFAPVINGAKNNDEIIGLLQKEIEKLYTKLEEIMEGEENARRVSL
ncbi:MULTISPECIES: phage tail tape measure protein [unclassified Fusobacterium]|uniref:phage tail tape measure protein n=1 Tax=unclassified Fusobacterium TaxID=2648384 RepID=UPI001B8B87D6|nr:MULTISPECIES: phage tail tape measure protein [unclassified Fusobacterium]MBR8701462.1 hypothetical protein [Fusobacterium sp. DD45]MBR8711230.1 hypothetical protein [Fusobacterium sp. DD28]MBR8751777.1 hypothetical protein [Fusobacterium sp. DD26]